MRTMTRPTIRLASLLCGLTLLLGTLLPQFASAQSVASVPLHISTTLPDARLAGSGTFRWFGLKIYDAQLWTGQAGLTPDTLRSKPFALDLHYARHLIGQKIADASLDEIRKIGIGTPTQHKAWLASMTALFPDVEKDTHLTGFYAPGQATRFFLNGVAIGEVADPEFGAAFFAIWLHPKTSEPAFRRALLGLK